MIHEAFFWLGVATFSIAAIYGLAEGGLWLADKLLRIFGVWGRFFAVMKRMAYERRDTVPGG